MDGKKITNVNIESGDSGYEVRCSYMEEGNGSGDYEPMMHKSKDFHFSEKDSKAAFAKFLKLDKQKKGED
jgi:hypothetical protein